MELHVHFEGTVDQSALSELARRNGVALPTANKLAALYADGAPVMHEAADARRPSSPVRR
jgi:adenosine deaminase